MSRDPHGDRGQREGSPYPVARLSLEAVANAFVVLGLLPAARAEEIFIAQQYWPLIAPCFRVTAIRRPDSSG